MGITYTRQVHQSIKKTENNICLSRFDLVFWALAPFLYKDRNHQYWLLSLFNIYFLYSVVSKIMGKKDVLICTNVEDMLKVFYLKPMLILCLLYSPPGYATVLLS